MHATADPPRARFTAAQFYRMGEAGAFVGKRVALVEGEVLEMPAEGAAHFAVLHRAAKYLRSTFEPEYQVRETAPLELSASTDPEPDLAVVPARADDWETGHPRTALLVVEISDTTLRYNRGFKKRLYAEAGIAEYWIINIPDRCFEVHREPGAGGYGSEATIGEGGRITPNARPDAVLNPADVLPQYRR